MTEVTIRYGDKEVTLPIVDAIEARPGSTSRR